MADKNLRKLERAAAQGDVEAGVRHLNERIRTEVSALTIACKRCLGGAFLRKEGCSWCDGTGREIFPWSRRTSLAAFCGHEVCEIIEGYTNPMYMDHIAGICQCGWCETEQGFGSWISHLLKRPQEIGFRAALAAARVVAPDNDIIPWRKTSLADGVVSYTAPDTKTLIPARQALKAIETWLACPCAGHREVCRALGKVEEEGASGLPWFVGGILWAIAGAPTPHHTPEKNCMDAIRDAVNLSDKDSVQERICADLISWSLS